MATQNAFKDLPEIVWPNCTELAKTVGLSLSAFTRLARLREAQTKKVGRDVRVDPVDAISVLVTRGFHEDAAEKQVADLVESRSHQLLVFRTQRSGHQRKDPDMIGHFSFDDEPPLELSYMSTNAPPAREMPAPDMTRFDELDRMLAGTPVSIEEYIAADRAEHDA